MTMTDSEILQTADNLELGIGMFVRWQKDSNVFERAIIKANIIKIYGISEKDFEQLCFCYQELNKFLTWGPRSARFCQNRELLTQND